MDLRLLRNIGYNLLFRNFREESIRLTILKTDNKYYSVNITILWMTLLRLFKIISLRFNWSGAPNDCFLFFG